MTNYGFGNCILSDLSPEDLDLLTPFRPVDFRVGDSAKLAREADQQVVFPQNGSFSLLVTMADGASVEVANIGREGLLGPEEVSGFGRLVSSIIVQDPSKAYVVPLARFKQAMDRSSSLRRRIATANSLVLAQVQMAAACNATHTAHARVCRRILELHDRCRSPVISVTQGLLSAMLGLQRTTVTLVASRLQADGAIVCRRGKIRIVNSAKLEGDACECYQRLKSFSARIALEAPAEPDATLAPEIHTGVPTVPAAPLASFRE